jgi:predicted CXXCH cytochrome family protein
VTLTYEKWFEQSDIPIHGPMAMNSKVVILRLVFILFVALYAAIAISSALCRGALFSGTILASSQSDAASKSNSGQSAPTAQNVVDPAAWGSNHVGKPIPDYVHGDECLFCHRNDIGPGWQKNAHGITVRQREDAPELQSLVKEQPVLAPLAADIQYFMGSRQRVRFLKKEGYGKFALLSTQAVIDKAKHPTSWVGLDHPVWDTQKFANQCAGCHATAVDSKTRAFSAFGLDCYTCHGNVNLEHTNDTSLIFLSKKSKKDPKAIESTCASCHLRMAQSKSTGLPYPNNFVAGDNLFQDYRVDFSGADDANLNPGDRHILQNVRDVVVNGQDFPTCVNCHQVHTGSSEKHRRAPRSEMCFDCHNTNDQYKSVKPYTVKSQLCEY